ncbi:hypothetical protein PMAYCL1PPCAC_25129, partial [Pristionchus mayeri]
SISLFSFRPFGTPSLLSSITRVLAHLAPPRIGHTYILDTVILSGGIPDGSARHPSENRPIVVFETLEVRKVNCDQFGDRRQTFFVLGRSLRSIVQEGIVGETL